MLRLCKKFFNQLPRRRINVKTVATITKNFNGQDLTDFKALLEAGAVGFSDDGIPLESSKVVKEAMEEAKKLITFISLHEEDPGLNGTLGFNENIAKEHFPYLRCYWGGRVCYDCA